MKLSLSFNSILLCLGTLLYPNSIKAQSASDFASISILKEDLNLLAEGYLNPALTSLNQGMNTTWVSSAKTHELLGFDIRIGSSLVIIPSIDHNFTPDGLQYFQVPTSTLPTISGTSSVTRLRLSIPSTSGYDPITTDLDFPGGLGSTLPIQAIPIPFAQIGLGIIPNTDILVRWVPNSTRDDVSLGLLGIGVKHTLSQYFGIPRISPYQFAILAAYSKAHASKKFIDSEQIDDLTLSFGSKSDPSSLGFETESKTIQFIGSIDLPMLTIYSRLGHLDGTSSFLAKGNYKVTYQGKVNDQLISYESVITNPVHLSMDTKTYFASVGATLKVLFLHFYGDYTVSKNNSVNVGIALSFR